MLARLVNNGAQLSLVGTRSTFKSLIGAISSVLTTYRFSPVLIPRVLCEQVWLIIRVYALGVEDSSLSIRCN